MSPDSEAFLNMYNFKSIINCDEYSIHDNGVSQVSLKYILPNLIYTRILELMSQPTFFVEYTDLTLCCTPKTDLILENTVP
jgi:hypothetical protein